MRQFLQHNKWATYLVVGFFMLATSGLALTRMTCLSAGHSVLSVGVADACCAEEALATFPTVKPVCCEVHLVQGGLEEYLPHAPLDLVFFAWAVCDVLAPVPAPQRVVPATWLGSRPPPLSVHERLAAISVQRV